MNMDDKPRDDMNGETPHDEIDLDAVLDEEAFDAPELSDVDEEILGDDALVADDDVRDTASIALVRERTRLSIESLRAIGIIAATVVTIVGLGLLAQRQLPPDEVNAVTVEPIRSAVLLCPEPGSSDADLGVRITGAVIPGQPGQAGGGSAALTTLPGKESARSVINTPGGQAQVNAFGRRLPPIVAYGSGSLAPGLVADQWGRQPRGEGRGLASTACAPAATDFWFVGGGAIAGRQTRIVLVNPDETSAVVDLVIHGPDGIIDTPGGRGLVVDGQARQVIRLDTLVPGVRATAVHVIVRTGRIGAAVDDDQSAGLQSIGSDWIPAAAAPATLVYVPGIMPGKGARVLSLVAPGDLDARVSIRVLTRDGAFAPAERDRVLVPGGSVITMDMASVVGGIAATLEITSDTPVVAGMRQFFGGRGVAQDETAFSSGSQPFTAPAAVSGLPVRAATDVRVAITAPTEDVVVDITVLPFAGGKDAAVATEPRTVRVPAQTVRFVDIPLPSGVSWFTAVVTPREDSGPVLVAHRVRERSRFGDLVTGFPWQPLRVEVNVPTASQDSGLTVR